MLLSSRGLFVITDSLRIVEPSMAAASERCLRVRAWSWVSSVSGSRVLYLIKYITIIGTITTTYTEGGGGRGCREIGVGCIDAEINRKTA